MTATKKWDSAYIEAKLLEGKVLVLPEHLYEMGMKRLRSDGVSEQALESVQKTKYLPESEVAYLWGENWKFPYDKMNW